MNEVQIIALFHTYGLTPTQDEVQKIIAELKAVHPFKRKEIAERICQQVVANEIIARVFGPKQ